MPDLGTAIDDALVVVLTLTVPPVAAILAGALWKLSAKWGFEAKAQDKANLEAELQTALQAGISKALPHIERAGWDDPMVHSQIISDAAGFMSDRFPDRAAEIINAGPAPSGETLRTTIAARLPDAMTRAAASPATPPTDEDKTPPADGRVA